MSKNIAEGLGRMISSKSAIDGAITAKGGVVTKGLENSATDIGTIPIPPPPVLIDKTITENGTYLPEDEYEVITLTNQTSPVELEDCNGDDAELSVKGNTVQNGTPTPQNPIQPNGTGERTAQLYYQTMARTNLDSSGTLIYDVGDAYDVWLAKVTAGKTYTVTKINGCYGFFAAKPELGSVTLDGTRILADVQKTFTVPSGANYVAVRYLKGSTGKICNEGETLLPYEPYGYKLDIESGSTTTPVYLGQVESTRKIKKYEFTGQESFFTDTSAIYNNTLYFGIHTEFAVFGSNRESLNSHFRTAPKGYNPQALDYECSGFHPSSSYSDYYYMRINLDTIGVSPSASVNVATTAFKAWVTAQYAAGTPVCVWYVLANSTTGVVNEPLMKIGDYVDTLTNVSIPTTEGDNTITIDTTVPPSSIDVSYNKLLGAEGYSSVTADVPNTYTVEDEGKVVSSGALVPQTALAEEITDNGTVDTTLFNSVTVNVHTGVDPEPINAVLEEANDELEAALGGGGSIPVPKGQVNFYDYDGTLVKSMSSAQFRGLESMPTNPSHEGLTAQGWNWSLSDAKTYVAKYGSLDIGQMYVTSDGKTRLYISLPEGRTSPILQLYLNANSELDIDWGDGSTHSTFTSTNIDYKSERHVYPTPGDYVISITVTTGGFILQSSSTTVSSILWNGNNTANSPDKAYNNAIKKIEIGNNVTSIGQYAFQYCYSLSSVTIPDSVTSIGSSTFSNCNSLSSVTLPNTLTSIGSNAFYYCYSLSSITIPNTVTSIGQYAFYGCYPLSSITLPDTVTSIGDSAFSYCHSLSSITIPDSVTSIGSSTFQSCISLSSITIPDSVTSIGSKAFYNCTSLSSITIPDGVTTIGSYAFNNCSSLSSITIPDGVTSIDSSAFYNCRSLSSITIPDGVTSIGQQAFDGCSSLSSITIPDGVTSIDQQAFNSCSSLSSITIPDGVTTIGTNAFQGCYSLSSITIPDGVTSIGNIAFANCSSLSSVTIPDSVTSIGSSAFSSCSSLSSITIPNTVTSIDNYAFSGCSYMSYIKFESTTPPTVTSSYAWSKVSTSTVIYVPSLVSNLYMNGTNYPSKTSYTYLGYATYTSGEALPTTTTDETYTLTWYATSADAIAQTNPITQGTGDEVYSRATPVA